MSFMLTSLTASMGRAAVRQAERVLRLLRPAGNLRAVALLVGICGVGCGSRSGVDEGELPVALAPQTPSGDAASSVCAGPLDCISADRCNPETCENGVCVARATVCDDGDPCSRDSCDPDTGACVAQMLHEDRDGDGYFAILPGVVSAPPECGGDCNDEAKGAFPGAIERCDGIDNNCDGRIDEGARYVAADMPTPARVSQGPSYATPAGLAYVQQNYWALYEGKEGRLVARLAQLDAGGQPLFSEAVSQVASDTFAGAIARNGNFFGVTWEDRSNNDFEVYFARFDTDGNKVSRDLRLSNSPGFSLGVSLVESAGEYLAVWSDRREGLPFEIYAQRISETGEALADNIKLSVDGRTAEGVSVASGEEGVAVTYLQDDGKGLGVRFRAASRDLSTLSNVVKLGPDGVGNVAPEIVFNKDRYVVVWHQANPFPGSSIWGAVVLASGEIVVPAQPIVGSSLFAASKAVLPLGDRSLVVWAQAETEGYDLFAQLLDQNLIALDEPIQLTGSFANAVSPSVALGPDGDVGVIYEDDTRGQPQVYFTRLACWGL